MVETWLFDPHAATRAQWSAVHLFRRARDTEDGFDNELLDDPEFERQLCHLWPLYESRRWFAWNGDEVVGIVGASTRREGTADYDVHAPHAYAWGGVRAHQRRRGIATLLMRPLLDFMRERGKTVATVETSTPDGDAFLAALGATPKHRQVENRALFAALDGAMLARWHDDAVPSGAPLRWEVHPSRVPRERIETLNPQFAALQADMPLGDLDVPPARSDVSAWLAWYEDLDRHGGDHSLVMLMHGDAVAAVCEAVWDARFPDRVFQRLTAVARTWRGRGLAKGVKAALIRLIRDRHPEVRFVTTSNATVNAPMLSINARLGFAPHCVTTSYQVRPDEIAAYLARRVGSTRGG